MQKDGLIYKKMKRYRRKYLIINIVCTILYLAFITWRFPYIRTQMTGSTALDESRFIAETGTMVIDEVIELGRKETKTPESACFRDSSYWQDGRYLYDMEIKDIADAGKSFTSTIDTGMGEPQEVEVYKVYTASIEGRRLAILANAKWQPTEKVTGYLSEFSRPVMAKVSETLTKGEKAEYSSYMIDLRGLEMDTANTDYACFWIFMALLVFLWAKLVLHYVNPLRTPTYRQLVKYGEVLSVEEDVNTQAAKDSVYKEKGKLILDDYILYKGTFKYEVKRNHMSRN